MSKSKKSTRKFGKLTLLVISVLILLVAGGLVYHYAHTNDSNTYTPPTNTENPSANPVNQAVSNAAKQRDLEQEKAGSSTSSSNSTKSVQPVITYAGEISGIIKVSSYVPIFETGGTCTTTFSTGSTSFSRTSSGVQNAQSVVCPTISISSSQFSPKGQWQVVVKYSSSDASGVSNSQSFEVQ